MGLHSPYHQLTDFAVPHSGGASISFPPQSLSPIQICEADNYPKIGDRARPVTLGIGSLGGIVTDGDLASAASYYGIPKPDVEVIPVGGITPTSSPGGANVENMLDILLMAAVWSYCTGTVADIKIAIGPNQQGGMAQVTRALLEARCGVINWSWGGPNSRAGAGDRDATGSAIADTVSAGVPVCVASGDSSEDDGTGAPTVDYPAGDVNSWAVGGTHLELGAGNEITSERAWGDGRADDPGGGGGFDPDVPLPSWQEGVVSGKYRGVPDSSANADPNSGYQIWADGKATVVGGTSGASPMTAGLFAVCKASGATVGQMGPLLYPARSVAFHDITVGSNGEPAEPGWDPATGLGSPDGSAILSALPSTGAA